MEEFKKEGSHRDKNVEVCPFTITQQNSGSYEWGGLHDNASPSQENSRKSTRISKTKNTA